MHILANKYVETLSASSLANNNIMIMIVIYKLIYLPNSSLPLSRANLGLSFGNTIASLSQGHPPNLVR